MMRVMYDSESARALEKLISDTEPRWMMLQWFHRRRVLKRYEEGFRRGMSECPAGSTCHPPTPHRSRLCGHDEAFEIGWRAAANCLAE